MALSPKPHDLSLAAFFYLLLPFIVIAIYTLAKRHGSRASLRKTSSTHVASLPGLSPEESWKMDPDATIQHALSVLTPDENFQVMTPAGPLLVLRNKYAKEVAQHPDMSLAAHLRKTYFPDYPGFEGVRVGLEGHIHDTMREAVAQRLTHALGSLIDDLAEETTYAVDAIFGNHEGWTTVELGPGVLDLVNRITSRVLVGKRMCRSDDWRYISKEYLACSARASASLAAIPGLIRPIGHWFSPDCRRLREMVRRASTAIREELLARDTVKQEAIRRGGKAKETCDAITWLCEESKTRGRRLDTPDLVTLQLGLSVAANHTTTEAALHAICHLCEHPSVVPPLREEIIKTLGDAGWSKASFHQLQLMDSFLLESQRHSRGPLTLLRMATDKVVLSTGFVIEKDTMTQVLVRNFDPAVYQDPCSFDPSRFLDMRAQAGQSYKWQFATSSPEQMGFGLGRHACPGRFYVANELKMIFAHLLMRYEWCFDPTYGQVKKTGPGGHPVPDYAARIRCKKREEEVHVDRVAK